MFFSKKLAFIGLAFISLNLIGCGTYEVPEATNEKILKGKDKYAIPFSNSFMVVRGRGERDPNSTAGGPGQGGGCGGCHVPRQNP